MTQREGLIIAVDNSDFWVKQREGLIIAVLIKGGIWVKQREGFIIAVNRDI